MGSTPVAALMVHTASSQVMLLRSRIAFVSCAAVVPAVTLASVWLTQPVLAPCALGPTTLTEAVTLVWSLVGSLSP